MPPRREYDRHPDIIALTEALKVGNYSFKTFKNYKQALITLIRYVGNKPIEEVTKTQYQKYLLFLIEKKRLGSGTINVHINRNGGPAWKFYQEKVLLREKEFYDVPYPRQAQKLPTVYSVEEVKAIFKATTSLKYRTLFRMVYATGMRLSEVAHLRLTDIDQARQLIIIKAGKGKKDRVVMLSAKLLNELNEYLLRYKPGAFLFEDITSGEPLAVRTIQRVYSEATRFGGIQKRGGIHSLRHSLLRIC